MMAYRRRQQVGRDDSSYDSVSPRGSPGVASQDSYSSLASKAIRASSAYRDSSLSSLYEQSALSSPRGSTPSPAAKDSSVDEPSPKKNVHESKQGFWGVLARKARSIIDDDEYIDKSRERPGWPTLKRVDKSKKGQYDSTCVSPEGRHKNNAPALQKGFDAITSSLNYIGTALEEGITAVENRTADIIQETRNIQIRKKSGLSKPQNLDSNIGLSRQQHMHTLGQPHMHTDLETQLKASRDVAMAMAAKAKLLLRELKTVKADLAFAKERCGQLEEENRVLRESREKGDNPEDDDLIRLQLESLLAEKARLNQENSVYARENRFLREIVEYHQLTMQDVVYLDECSEEVTEFYPIKMTSPGDIEPLDRMPSSFPTPTHPPGVISAVVPNISSGSFPAQEVSVAYRMHADDVKKNTNHI